MDFIKLHINRLVMAFPTIDNNFKMTLIDRVLDNGFTKKKLYDSISHVIDNFTYQRPTIADVVSFDKRIKIYNYAEVCEYCFTCKMSSSKLFTFYKTNMYILNADIERYNLKLNK